MICDDVCTLCNYIPLMLYIHLNGLPGQVPELAAPRVVLVAPYGAPFGHILEISRWAGGDMMDSIGIHWGLGFLN